MTMQRLMATFRPQVWQRDNLLNIDGVVEFDATAEFLQLTLRAIKQFKEHDYDSDRLAESLPARQEHTGPFEVDVDIDAWLAAHGVPGRQSMTQADLDRLQKLFITESIEQGQARAGDIAALMDVICAGIGESPYEFVIDSSDNDNDSGEIYVDSPLAGKSFVIKVTESPHEPE